MTWGEELDGAAFVEKADQYEIYGSDKSILEIGPGYVRLLRSALAQSKDFASYTGADLSLKNVSFLLQNITDPRVRFIEADCETSNELGGPYTSVISSLTLKHIYPDMRRALRKIRSVVSDGGIFCFDVIEGTRTDFQTDGITYIRQYTRDEIEEILGDTGYKLVSFDQVEHTKLFKRLFVVSKAI